MAPFLSEEKHTHLSHLILQYLEQTREGHVTGSSTLALREIKRWLAEHMLLENEIEQLVRARLQSYSRKIPEGSSEWEVMYHKTYREELRKRKFA